MIFSKVVQKGGIQKASKEYGLNYIIICMKIKNIRYSGNEWN